MIELVGLCMRTIRDTKAISNVIVVMLSLILVVVIVANVVLWSYEMNKFDWERMQEDLDIIDVAAVSYSWWFATQSEYTVNKGKLASGNYTDTRKIGDSYETFTESNAAQEQTLHPNADGTYAEWGKEYPRSLVHWDCCDEDPPDDDSSYVETSTPNWKIESYNLENHTGSGTINWVQVYVRAKLTGSGTVNVRTLVRTCDTDYESNDIALSASYEDKYTRYDLNPKTGQPWTWDEIDSLQAGVSGQRLGNVTTRSTAVWVVVNYSPPGSNELDLNGTFSIDVSTYPSAYIQSVEIQLGYKADDTLENWYLKAYNWTDSDYSDSGFNNTLGHTPTTGWDTYGVNLTDKWRSYVDDSGTLQVKLQDSEADVNETTIDIDFLAVRALIDGTNFTLCNKGSLTIHLVSLWVNIPTHHQRYDINIFVNSGEMMSYIRSDISLPDKPYLVKVITERGNTATNSES